MSLSLGLFCFWMIKCNPFSFCTTAGKQCMGLVDLDRSWAAETHGYSVQVMTMEPESCSPKNNMLVGRHKSGLEVGASQLEALVHN